MRIAILTIADKFKLIFKRLLYDLGPEVLCPTCIKHGPSSLAKSKKLPFPSFTRVIMSESAMINQAKM